LLGLGVASSPQPMKAAATRAPLIRSVQTGPRPTRGSMPRM
jgi:hypothetical protein